MRRQAVSSIAPPGFESLMIGKLIGLILAACLFAAIPQHASAQSYGPCTDSKTTMDAITCLGKAGPEAYTRLEALRSRIRNIMKKYDPPLDAQFDAGEAQWDHYMNLTCSELFDKLYDGGTIRLPNIMACELDATERHHALLSSLFGFQLWQHRNR
jgi:hypothetical protein